MSRISQSLRERARIRGFAGAILVDGEPGCEEGRQVVNAAIDRRPALIAYCTCASDVVAALRHARELGLETSVRGGGHAAAGFAVVDGGVVIDLRRMSHVRVDAAARTVRVGGGAIWKELDRQTQEHGLAVTGARLSSVGVAGFTLASGSGWLERLLGLASDNLVAAEVVTADGEVVRAADDANADLLWALRGGGGNFGVVTELELRLHAVGPTVLAGRILYRWEDAAEVACAYREEMARAPDHVGGGLSLMEAPPGLGPDERGPLAAVLFFVDAQAGHEERGPLGLLSRAARAVADTVAPMPYFGFQSLTDPPAPRRLRLHYECGFLRELPDLAIASLIAQREAAPSSLCSILLTPFGGAAASGPDAALPRRDASWAWQATAAWPRPEEDDAHRRWAAATRDAVAPWSAGEAYPNLIADPDPERIRASYGDELHDRLLAVKRRWDADNVFRGNHNLAP